MKRTAAELRARRQRGEAQVNSKDAAERALPSGNDADDAMEEIDWATTALPRPRRKEHTSLRLDADMLSWFRAQGRGSTRKSTRSRAPGSTRGDFAGMQPAEDE